MFTKKRTCLRRKELHGTSTVVGHFGRRLQNSLVGNRWNKEGKVTGGKLRMLLSNSEISGRENICFSMRQNLGRDAT